MSPASRNMLAALALLGVCSCADATPAAIDAAASAPPDGSITALVPGCALQACPASDDRSLGSPVSFRRDLAVSLQRNCSDVVCHGSPGGSQAGFYLSPPLPLTIESSSVRARMVGVPSLTAPDLPLIAPGEPERSFLRLKVEGCQNTGGFACRALPGANGTLPCGDTMPRAARPLCNADRDLLRRWILQGAGDN